MIKYCFKKEEISELEAGLQYAAPVRGFAAAEDGIPVHISRNQNGYCVREENGQIFLSYGKKHEFFRAIALTTGLLEEERHDFSFCGESSFALCGAMIDCSRNAVLRPEKAIEFFCYAALMGMNCVMLYTEDTYAVEGYPYFGYMRGRYTQAELKQLDSAAEALGLELIPCIQTLAHLKTALRWGYAKNIRDNDDILLAGDEKTYELIRAMFKSVRSCFTSSRIHIGMDEAFDVGLGDYLRKNGYQDRFEILSAHLQRVCEIAQEYGFKPMMWSDMFFRLGSSQGEYYDFDAKIPAGLSAKIPSNLSMVYWDYYHHDKQEYVSMMNGHKELGREVIFAGGVWTWRGMGPGYKKTFATTVPALQACRETGVQNVITTIWGDDGGEVCAFLALLGMQLYAEYNYSMKTDMQKLQENFRLCTGLDAQLFLAASLDDLPDGVKMEEGYAPVSKIILYQDVLCGLFDKNLSCFALGPVYESMAQQLQQLKLKREFQIFVRYYEALLRVLARKCHMGIKIRNAYKAHDIERLSQLCEELKILLEEYTAFHAIAYTVWHQYNKPFGYDKYDSRLGGTEARIICAIKRLQEYIMGKTNTLPELEEELLWYGSEKSAGEISLELSYKNMSSASAEF